MQSVLLVLPDLLMRLASPGEVPSSRSRCRGPVLERKQSQDFTR